MVIFGWTWRSTYGNRSNAMLNSISRNTIVQLAGRVASTVLGLAIVALMTRALGQSGYGYYTTVIAFLQFFGVLVDFGLTMTIGRELGHTAAVDQPKLIGNAVSFRVVTAGLAFALAPAIAWFLPYPLFIKTGITLTAVAFWAASLSQSLGAVFPALLKSGWGVATDLAGRLVMLTGVLIAVSQHLSLNAFLMSVVASNIISAWLTLAFVKRFINFSWRWDTPVFRHLWRVTWPVAMTIALNLIYFKADTLILSLLKPAADVGLYGAAYKVLEVLLAIPAIVGSLIVPLAARARRLDSSFTELKTLYDGTMDSLLAAGLAVIIGALTIGTPLMVWLAGSNFTTAGHLLVPLGLATACIFLGNGAGYFIFALDLQKKMLWRYALVAILSLIGYFIFIPLYSYWGAAWMTLAVEALMAVLSLHLLLRLGFRLHTERWPKLALASAGLTLGLLLPAPLLVKIIVGGVLYLALLWKLNLIPSELNTTPIATPPALTD